MSWAVIGLSMAVLGLWIGLFWAFSEIRQLGKDLEHQRRRIKAGLEMARTIAEVDQQTQERLKVSRKEDVDEDKDVDGNAADSLRDYFGNRLRT